MQIINGIQISSKNTSHSLPLAANLQFKNSETLQENVKKIVNVILKKQNSTGISIGARGLILGSDSKPENLIDAFSNVQFALPLDQLLQQKKANNDKPSKVEEAKPSEPGFHIEPFVDVEDANTLSISLKGDLKKVKGDFDIKLPFLQVDVVVGDAKSLALKVQNIAIHNRELSALALVNFKDNFPAQIFYSIASEIVWHRKLSSVPQIAITGLRFGFSESQCTELLSTVEVTFSIAEKVKSIHELVDKKRPLELDQWSSIGHQDAIHNDIIFKPFASGLKVDFVEVKHKIVWRAKDQNPAEFLVGDVLIKNFRLDNVKEPRLDLLLIPSSSANDGTAKALDAALPSLITFQDFCRDAFLTNFIMKGKSGKELMTFAKSEFHAPDLYFFKPIVINVSPRAPIIIDGKVILPVKILVKFPNPGAFSNDLGTLIIEAVSGSESILEFKSALNIKNVHQGGGPIAPGKYPTQIELEAALPLRNFNIIFVLKVIKRLLSGDGIKLRISCIKDGQHLTEIEKILSQLLDLSKDFSHREMCRTLGMALSHIEFEGLGIRQAEKALSASKNLLQKIGDKAHEIAQDFGGKFQKLSNELSEEAKSLSQDVKQLSRAVINQSRMIKLNFVSNLRIGDQTPFYERGDADFVIYGE